MWWKISAHSAATASFTILLGGLFGASLLPYLLGVPLMVWSRVRLKRHTLTQTLAGTLLGTLVIILLLGIWL
jgi:membrane-associated phospholipid phosphatase